MLLLPRILRRVDEAISVANWFRLSSPAGQSGSGTPAAGAATLEKRAAGSDCEALAGTGHA